MKSCPKGRARAPRAHSASLRTPGAWNTVIGNRLEAKKGASPSHSMAVVPSLPGRAMVREPTMCGPSKRFLNQDHEQSLWNKTRSRWRAPYSLWWKEEYFFGGATF